STHTCRPRCAHTSSPARSNGLRHGRATPRMSGAARTRCRWPPNTISAAWTRFRAIGVRPSTPSSPMPTMDNQRRGAAVSRASESPNDMRRLLSRGGPTEARRLAERLVERANVAVTVSLAGRTAAPATHAVPVRIGGFGGAEGLGEYLTAERVDALIDATHPYAAIISANAADAAAATRGPPLALRRPALGPASGGPWDGGGRGGGPGRGRAAPPCLPRARQTRDPNLRASAAAPLSRTQRRAGRSAARGAARILRHRSWTVHRGRRSSIAGGPRHPPRHRQ